MVVIITLVTATISSLVTFQSTYGVHLPMMIERKAPPAITGDNVYVAWRTNKTGNDEVLFRASPIRDKHLAIKSI